MRTFTQLFIMVCFLILGTNLFAIDKTVDTIIITQVDTFAMKGMPAQPILKIVIRVTGTTGSLTLEKLVIKSLNQNNADVDSVAVYNSIFDRFSLADYPGETTVIDKRRKIIGDSAVFTILTNPAFFLETGDNIFWVTMDLNKYSPPSHKLDAYIPANGIKISGVTYPTSAVSPTGFVKIFDIYFRDNFENKNTDNEPVGWTQSPIASSTLHWKNNYGGYTISILGHPYAPMSGKWNIMLQHVSPDPDTTILVSKALDLSVAARPILSFYHSQVKFCKTDPCTVSNTDELRVVYKIGSNGVWTELRKYELPTPNSWVKREITLPALANLYLGFKGIAQYGYGTCVDSLTIYETDSIPREVKSILASQPNQDIVPQGSSQNPIIRYNLKIKGTINSIKLNSLKLTSGNTADIDIASSGVKLFYTQDSVFLSPVQWGTAQSFVNGVANFTGINQILETGDNYLWVTYDVLSSATPGDILDASIKAGDIGLSISGSYPSSDLEAVGSRLVKQTLYFTDFETPADDLAWVRTGEFEMGLPRGLGGLNFGLPDPKVAYSGSKVLGTDLSGLGANPGDYEPNITNATAYTATSPLIDAQYFKNIRFDYQRWLNIDNSDSAFIEYKILGESNWKNLWTSEKKFIETKWNPETFPDLNFLKRKKFNIRFRLGYTDAVINYSGWNIDYLFLSGDYIPMDAAVTKYNYPLNACDLSANEHVRVNVKNTGPAVLSNFPIKLSIDGGKHFITETIAGPINPGDSIEYPFIAGSDFSKPSIYNIIVKVAHPLDNYPENDSIIYPLIAYPTYTLPYKTGFEQDTTFWYSGGVNSSWQQGVPAGQIINYTPEGTKCWKTCINWGGHYLYENSYVESPCFSFTGTTLPMMDVKYNHMITNTIDGAMLEYSLDKGLTWSYAREDNLPFSWNWYNDTITTLKHKGWTGNTPAQAWIQGRQVLPAALANQTSVKFRFAFKSDSTTNPPLEGFAFDDVKIYEAPFDLGVSTINGINNPACQFENSPYLNVTIKNFGYRRMQTGDTIIVGAKVNGALQAVDTFKLTSNLLKDATLSYTFKKRVNFDATGSYTIKAFTMIENDKTFYGGVNNDTASFSFTVNQNPITNMKKSYSTARLDTLVLKPATPVGYGYSWKHNASTSSAPTYLASDIGTYYLTVTNPGTGCQTKDTIEVNALQLNTGVTQIISPVTYCGYGTAFKPVIRFKNFGTDTLAINKIIPFRIRLNSNSLIKDSIKLAKAVAPDSSITVTLNATLDLSVAGAYQLMVRTYLLPYDIDNSNDSINTPYTFTIYGFPTVDLGPDVYKKTLSYAIHAPLGYAKYLWNDGSSKDSLVVTQTGKYKVTVTNTNLCEVSDSVNVMLSIRDLSIKRIISPLSYCTKPGLSTISCKLMNSGSDTIKTTEPISMAYSLNSGASVNQTLTLGSNLLPNDSVTFTFTQTEDIHLPGTYNFLVKATVANDLIRANDSILDVVNVYINPQINLGKDNIIHDLFYKLAPGNSFAAYQWQDNSTDSTYIITQTHNTSDNTYSAIVTDGNGCKGGDTVHIYLYVDDLKLDSIDIPNQLCSQPFPVRVKVSNSGSESYVDKDLIIRYKVNEDAEVIEAFKFTGSATNSSYYTFSTLVTPTTLGVNKIKATISMVGDLRRTNDTLTKAYTLVNSVNIDFGATNDTLIVNLPYTLDAGSGTNYSYSWNTAETTQSITATVNGKYTVTVTNGSCTSSKSVNVIGKITDLGISRFTIAGNNLPSTTCKFSTNQAAGFEVQNTGTEPLTNQSVTIRYQLNNGAQVSKAVTFTGARLDKSMYYFDDLLDLSQAGIQTFKLSLSYGPDGNPLNDTTTRLLNLVNKPTISFAGAVNDTIKARTLPVTLNPGAGAGYTYAWYDGSTTPTISTIMVRWHSVTISNGYCDTKDSVYVTDATPVLQLNGKTAAMVVYPNPVSEVLNIDLSLKSGDDVTLEFISSTGAMVKTTKLSGDTKYTQTIDVSALPKGIYYLRAYRKDWALIEKVIIQ